MSQERMKELLHRFETTEPEVVFAWQDRETEATGWVVINSLRGGATGGGTRMRKGLDKYEVLSLAKTMDIKHAISGPAIGGAKSGINFDPADPRKEGVLRRWFKAVMPLLKNYYGTGGDLNVDEAKEVVPMTEALGLWHPQEGVVNGHFSPTEGQRIHKISRLRAGVGLPVSDPSLTPAPDRRLPVADLVTGWGVSEAVRAYYKFYGGDLRGKRVIVQGWGTVAAPAACYLAAQGAKVVAIIDRASGLINEDGLSEATLRTLYQTRNGNALNAPDGIPAAELQARVWDIPVDIFLPCAASRLVKREQLERLLRGGLELVAAGANVPFDDPEIFYGATCEFIDGKAAVIPDFIANSGMARTFSYLMSEDQGELSERAIFADVSRHIEGALGAVHAASPAKRLLTSTALELVLHKVL